MQRIFLVIYFILNIYCALKQSSSRNIKRKCILYENINVESKLNKYLRWLNLETKNLNESEKTYIKHKNYYVRLLKNISKFTDPNYRRLIDGAKVKMDTVEDEIRKIKHRIVSIKKQLEQLK